MTSVSAVTFENKGSTIQYKDYDNNKSFLTPNNINDIKYVINTNAAALSTLNNEVVKSVNSVFPENGNVQLDFSNYVTNGDLINTSGNIIKWVTNQNYGQGTVLSVNNIYPVNGNVTIAIPSITGYATKEWVESQNYGTVKTVDNITPDSDGNVKLNLSTYVTETTLINQNFGKVKKVNGTSPDSTGNVSLPAITSVNGVTPIGGYGAITLSLQGTGFPNYAGLTNIAAALKAGYTCSSNGWIYMNSYRT